MPAECGCECLRMHCSTYHIWIIRSMLLKMATVLLFVAMLLDAVAVFTDHWLIGSHGSLGMFDYVVPKVIGTGYEVPLVCPILGVLSVLILLCANILNIVFATRNFFLVIPAVIVFSFIGALMQMTVIVLWSVPHVTTGQRLSWSFIVATVAVVVDMAGCGMCVMEFLSRREHSQFLSPREMAAFRQMSNLDGLSDSEEQSQDSIPSQNEDNIINLTEINSIGINTDEDGFDDGVSCGGELVTVHNIGVGTRLSDSRTKDEDTTEVISEL